MKALSYSCAIGYISNVTQITSIKTIKALFFFIRYRYFPRILGEPFTLIKLIEDNISIIFGANSGLQIPITQVICSPARL
jgi:hypothetical protein